jgi:DNA primase
VSTSRERLVEAHETADVYFSDVLRSARGQGPRDYLERRNLAAVPGRPDWAVGYAPPGWTTLLGQLRDTGFTDTEILGAGLAVATRRGTLIDRFRDRVVLGIRDDRGDVVGFVGRCPPGLEGRVPKYLNSPHTEIFAKGQLLFGLSEQRNRMALGVTPVVVEGPLDVLAIASLDEAFAAVSACGTALRPAQATRLRAACPGGVVVSAYDGDEAGRRAARTAYSRLSPLFDSVLSARLPDHEDPASLAAAAPDSLAGSLQSATPLLDDIVDDVLRGYPGLDNAEARVCALHETTRLLVRLSPRDVSRQVGRVSRKLGIEPSEVTRDLLEAVAKDQSQSTARGADSTVHRSDLPERRHRAASL